MLNQYIIEHWLLKQNRMSDKPLSQTQIDQAYARLAFACVGLLYLYLHAEAFAHYQYVFSWVTAIYFLSTLLSIVSIQRTPLSAYRILLFPLFDTVVVSFGMVIDGGLSSGLFFIFIVIIFGNSFRFGNAMLRYSQACSLIGLLLTCVYIDIYTPLNNDYTLLSWQIGALLIIPLYILLIVKKADHALKMQTEAEETSFNLMDKGPLPLFTFELDASQQPHITYANAAIHKLFQHDNEHLTQAPVDILSVDEDSQELRRFCQSVFEHNDDPEHIAQNLYIRGQDNDGNTLKLMCTAISMRWRRQWTGVCFVYDITQRENMQEELESVHRHAYTSTLVAGIVHDFRNVLTNMIGYAEVMQMNTANESEKQQLEGIIAAGDRGSELITHLLDLSTSPYTKTTPSHSKGIELIEPLEHIIGLARLQLPRQVQMMHAIGDPLQDVAISATEIEQILLNLINNATQSIAAAGHIEIQIRNDANHRLSKPGYPCLYIQVSDDGCGIPAEHLDTIFEAFWTSKKHRGGSGLGLTMVQRIIKRNHGSIDVTSELGQGTTFSIYIPAYIKEPEATANSQESMAITAKREAPRQLQLPNHHSNYHVLIVDDMPDILNIHHAMLSRMNITSETAINGKIALEIFQHKDSQFDLIITDYKMPKMDGLQLIEHIRKIDAKLPILMISAFAEDYQLQQVLENNVTLINKPINIEKLKTAITQVMVVANKQA